MSFWLSKNSENAKSNHNSRAFFALFTNISSPFFALKDSRADDFRTSVVIENSIHLFRYVRLKLTCNLTNII